MTVYELLRLLVNSGARTGGINKEQVYDALDLINQLQRLNTFGSTGSHLEGDRHVINPNL
jgi:hypothetical protein